MAPDQTALESLAREVAAIARRAGAAILTVYESAQIAVDRKDDASPLTEADLRSHEIIVRGLGVLAPSIPVLSEEQANIAYAVRARWPRYWLVDPLDGTKEFLARNGEFTVNIALIEGDAPILGVVLVPVSGALYVGIPGVGAWREEQGAPPQPLRVSTICAATSAPRIVGSRTHRGDSLDGFLQRVGTHTLVPVGSSLKFCMVAEGRADLYPRLGPTSEWDTAAAQAVVEGAGGQVVTLDGARLRYNTKAEYLNPHFLVSADRCRDWLALLRAS
jgi:3'(2'), 5'-bisphosphate nucleotidase